MDSEYSMPRWPRDLTQKELERCREDIFKVLDCAPEGVGQLRAAIAQGRINGMSYYGECCCLIGTLAKAMKCGLNDIPGVWQDPLRPAEHFFKYIHLGDTPETNSYSMLALYWVDEWVKQRYPAEYYPAISEEMVEV